MFINNYCTDFMFQGVMVCYIFIFMFVTHYFQFPFSFQDISRVCWNSCLKVLIMKFIHKFQQNEFLAYFEKHVQFLSLWSLTERWSLQEPFLLSMYMPKIQKACAKQ